MTARELLKLLERLSEDDKDLHVTCEGGCVGFDGHIEIETDGDGERKIVLE